MILIMGVYDMMLGDLKCVKKLVEPKFQRNDIEKKFKTKMDMRRKPQRNVITLEVPRFQ